MTGGDWCGRLLIALFGQISITRLISTSLTFLFFTTSLFNKRHISTLGYKQDKEAEVGLR